MNKWLGTMLSELAKKQEAIDNYIHKLNGKTFEETFNCRIIALFTEISEFTNELRSFKYWSKKSESERTILLEEYIDCIHFVLSIGNNINYPWEKYNLNINPDKNINSSLLNTYNNLAFFSQKQSISNFTKLLDSFFTIGTIKNFSKQELFDSYLHKNKKNYHRQDINY